MSLLCPEAGPRDQSSLREGVLLDRVELFGFETANEDEASPRFLAVDTRRSFEHLVVALLRDKASHHADDEMIVREAKRTPRRRPLRGGWRSGANARTSIPLPISSRRSARLIFSSTATLMSSGLWEKL